MTSNVSSRLHKFANRFVFAASLAGLGSVLLAQSTTPTPVADTASTGETIKLDVFSVTATQGRTYGASSTASATRINTPLENIPQSITVINSNLLNDLSAYSMDQAYRYVPGVTQRQNVPNGTVVRGLIVFNRYRNGFLLPGYESDTSNVDRIEVIKGPAASIAGSSEAGGYVNVITKLPLYKEESSASVTIGSRALLKGTIDVTGPVPGHENFAFRLIGTELQSDGWRIGERVRKTALFPSLNWKIGPNTSWLNEIEYTDSLTPSNNGSVYIASVYDTTLNPLPVSPGVTPQPVNLPQFAPANLNTGDIGFQDRSAKNFAYFSTFIHRINDVLSFRQAFVIYSFDAELYRTTPLHQHSYAPAGVAYAAAGDLVLPRGSDHTINGDNTFRLQGDLAAKGTLLHDQISYSGLLGYQVGESRTKVTTALGALQPLDIFNPVYGLPAVTQLKTTLSNRARNGSRAWFVNGQIGVWADQIIFTSGLRRDYGKNSWTLNLLNNLNVTTPKPPPISSPMYGINLKPTKWLSFYGVYSEAGALPVRNLPRYPSLPLTDPQQILLTALPLTKNTEFGVKSSLLDGRVSLSLAHFDTQVADNRRSNLDSSVPGGTENILEANAFRGLEMEWSGNVTNRLIIFGGWEHITSEISGFKAGSTTAKREQRGLPKDKVQLFAHYDLSNSNGQGFAVKVGVVYQTSVWGRAENNYRIPGATRYDAGLDYIKKDWQYSLFLENATDKMFMESSIAQSANTVDAPRTLYATVSKKF